MELPLIRVAALTMSLQKSDSEGASGLRRASIRLLAVRCSRPSFYRIRGFLQKVYRRILKDRRLTDGFDKNGGPPPEGETEPASTLSLAAHSARPC
jgi:hypothetical protein